MIGTQRYVEEGGGEGGEKGQGGGEGQGGEEGDGGDNRPNANKHRL